MTRFPNERRIFVFAAACLVLFYVPTVWHGYFNDDFYLIGTTFREWWQNPFAYHGRPIWLLSFPLANLVSTSSYWHHAVNVMLFGVLCALCAWIIKREELPKIAYLLCLAALCHPAMMWPVSWISQRNDLLLLIFVFLAAGLFRHRAGATWVVFSSWSKAPFVFQNLVFAFLFLRSRRFVAAVLAILSSLIALYFVWHSYYQVSVAGAAHGLYLLQGNGAGHLLVVALFRGAKIAEGVFLAFIPVPAYATSIPFVLGISLMLLLMWGTLAYVSIRNWSGWRDIDRRRLSFYLSLAASLALPYAFGSGLRIYVPATLFLFLVASFVVPNTRLTRFLVLGVAGIFLLGSFLNYGPMMTRYYDLDAPVGFQTRPVPANTWNAMRRELIDGFVVRYLLGQAETLPTHE